MTDREITIKYIHSCNRDKLLNVSRQIMARQAKLKAIAEKRLKDFREELIHKT